MKDKYLRDSRISKLSKEKVKGVRLLETIYLKIIGYIDGTRNLPRECGDGKWISPHLDREIRSYHEFSSRIWGYLQIEEENEYKRLGELMDSLVYTRTQLETTKAELKDALSYEEMPDVFCKHGEGKLNDTQVAARRITERAKSLVLYKNRIVTLQNKLVSEADEFFALRNQIIEADNSTRMICARVKEHLFQRIDVYWNSALHKHSEKERMPVIPSIEVTSRAERVYIELHSTMMLKSEMLNQSLSKDKMEVA